MFDESWLTLRLFSYDSRFATFYWGPSDTVETILDFVKLTTSGERRSCLLGSFAVPEPMKDVGRSF